MNHYAIAIISLSYANIWNDMIGDWAIVLLDLSNVFLRSYVDE